MRVLGVDQSLTSTGVAVLDAGTLDVLEAVRPGRLRGCERVQFILDRVCALARTCDAVAVEGPAMHAQGSAVTAIFGLYGCLVQDLWRMGHSPWVVPPSVRALYATGKGNAGKDQVLAAVIHRYGDERIVGNDLADALVIADIVARRLGEPLPTARPVTARGIAAVFEKVAAPGPAPAR